MASTIWSFLKMITRRIRIKNRMKGFIPGIPADPPPLQGYGAGLDG